MASRDVWSHGSGSALRDLLSSALASLLMAPAGPEPAYFSSPWMSDFPLFENYDGDFVALFPELADERRIRFSDYLHLLSRRRPVRIIAVRHPISETFARIPALQESDGVQFRYAPEIYHEKGVLTPGFYIEGSMNITYNGVHVRGEKITFHSGVDGEQRAKIASAYLEFNRRWQLLAVTH
ncbi:MAG TPA: hypothetical protein VM510_05355 [Caulifigura sp.]|jgi:hypothetical protein|nr:hypothetical protein [Caulifigura sp.]